MVKFKVLKEELKSEYSDFEIPIQITLEGYERGLGLGYLENELVGKHTRRKIRVESNDKIFVGFKKEETDKLLSIIQSIKESLELIIKKYATDKEKGEKQRIESEEKREQDLKEVREKLEKLEFEEVSI